MNSSSPPKETVINFSKDFGFVTESLVSHPSPSHLSMIPESPAPDTYGQLKPQDARVSLNENVPRSSAEEEEVVVCSSNNSFRTKSSLMRTRTKSRLLDPPEEIQPVSQTLSHNSQVLEEGTSEIDDDDPFLEEDLPEAYKKIKFSFLSIIQLVSLIIICTALVCSLTINILRNKKMFGLDLWKWELMVLVLISGRLVSGWATSSFLHRKEFSSSKTCSVFHVRVEECSAKPRVVDAGIHCLAMYLEGES